MKPNIKSTLVMSGKNKFWALFSLDVHDEQSAEVIARAVRKAGIGMATRYDKSTYTLQMASEEIKATYMTARRVLSIIERDVIEVIENTLIKNTVLVNKISWRAE